MSLATVPPLEKYFLRLKEAATMLGVSERTMRRILKEDRAPTKPRAVRVGAGWRLPTQEFITWANNQKDRWPPPKRKR